MAIIQVEAFSYSYPLTTIPALHEVNLEVQEGEFIAIIGANGAGKSSLCLGIAGFLHHHFHGQIEGRVLFKGKSVDDASLGEWIRHVGLVFQNPFTQLSSSKLTVYEEIAFGLENLGTPRDEMIHRIDKVMEFTRISDLADRSPYALSGGQQQRLALASILAMEPSVLVLDEPTSQLDPIGTREVFQSIKDLSASGVTVLMAEHKLEWVAEFADRVVVMHNGEIRLQGKPGEVLTSSLLPELGCNVTRYTSIARAAHEIGQWPTGRRLPVTLAQATAGFRGD
jgi:energy-coupling factor transporter ATP-binding protein EcfA2